jgi:hypothetical protein
MATKYPAAIPFLIKPLIILSPNLPVIMESVLLNILQNFRLTYRGSETAHLRIRTSRNIFTFSA